MLSWELPDSEAKWFGQTKTISGYSVLLSTIHDISHDALSLLQPWAKSFSDTRQNKSYVRLLLLKPPPAYNLSIVSVGHHLPNNLCIPLARQHNIFGSYKRRKNIVLHTFSTPAYIPPTGSTTTFFTQLSAFDFLLSINMSRLAFSHTVELQGENMYSIAEQSDIKLDTNRQSPTGCHYSTAQPRSDRPSPLQRCHLLSFPRFLLCPVTEEVQWSHTTLLFRSTWNPFSYSDSMYSFENQHSFHQESARYYIDTCKTTSVYIR